MRLWTQNFRNASRESRLLNALSSRRIKDHRKTEIIFLRGKALYPLTINRLDRREPFEQRVSLGSPEIERRIPFDATTF